MVKKAGILALALILLCTLAGCASRDETSPTKVMAGATQEVVPEETPAETASESDFGAFTAKTLAGDEVTQEIFANKKVTLVNVWATWCGPCIMELPELQTLSEKLDGTDAQVIGIVHDTYSKDGENPEAVEMAEYIRDELGLTYTNIIPDKALMDGVGSTIASFPTTWFVDADGNIIGDPVVGRRDEAAFAELLNEKLAEVSE